MASTPPPVSLRAHTPPTPMHGPLHDNYEPYSPRRSKRTTAHANPYASSHSDRPPKAHLQRATTPPPTTSKKARFISTQLSSPPSSPASPARRTAQHHKTPRKTPVSRAFADLLSDPDNTPRRQVPTPLPELSMLPTPSKTPKKRNSAMNSTARILNFQPYSPNDVMPTPRKMKKSSHKRGQSSNDFNLFEEGTGGSQEQIEIYTDSNARIPEMDGSEDNPFVGPRKKPTRKAQRRVRTDEEEEMEQRAERDEGMVYTFRGKKVFRRFADNDDDATEEPTSPEPNLHQRSLRRQAGAAAERRLTRSSIKPRLLFPNEDQIREREPPTEEEEVDEEALTDIEVPVPTPRKSKTATPSKPTPSRFSHLATPPSTKRTKRVVDRAPDAAALDVVVEESEETPKSPVERKGGKVKNRSPFDDWPRSKSGPFKAGKKRDAPESPEPASGSSKRTRSGAVASPA